MAPLGRAWAPVTPRHFAWQAWHNLTSTVVSRGRRGTKSHLPSFCVAGMAQMVLGGALGPGLGACDAAALCVAGVAQLDIHRRFTWQAWHKLTSAVVLRGRRGTDATGWRPWAGLLRQHTLCHHILCHHTGCPHTLYQRILRQHTLCHHTLCHHTLWHNLTSTVVSRGRRGTN